MSADKPKIPFQSAVMSEVMGEDTEVSLRCYKGSPASMPAARWRQRCSIYDDRPTGCRYYPVALLSIRPKDSPDTSQNYSLVQDEYCKGHDEDRKISIGDYPKEQGCSELDELNQE